MNQSRWYINEIDNLPDDFFNQIENLTQEKEYHYLAILLWNRGIRDLEPLEFLLNINQYQPKSYLEFKEEIDLAIARINQARIAQEKIAIWGNWRVDSIMSACILNEGLTEFFADNNQFIYHFSDRHLSCFGLTYQGIDELALQEVTLIIVTGTGSYNIDQVHYAHSLGIDIIILDRPMLSIPRPSVVSWLNPHNFPTSHPFYHFCAVAIAYKLIEGLATEYSSYFGKPITNLLDLVALGLLAQNVNLQGDGRSLARQGIVLIKQKKRQNITSLAETGFQIGDRALDRSYGLCHRIKGLISLYTDPYFVINLLTNKNFSNQNKLVDQAEKAYFNYLDLVQKTLDQAKKQVKNIDLSNTVIISLQNNQWHLGILDVVAKTITQEYGKPTIILSSNFNDQFDDRTFGYISSLDNLDLSPLIINCHELLDQYIVVPDGIKIILPTENIHLFIVIIT